MDARFELSSDRIKALGKAIRVLTATKRRLTAPGQWTSGAGARNLRGFAVAFDCSTAVSWSLDGALRLEAVKEGGGLLTAVAQVSRSLPASCSLARLNDVGGHRLVMEFLDTAIERAMLMLPSEEVVQ
jgi:hypothetical protein